jgi:hypothetical protein
MGSVGRRVVTRRMLTIAAMLAVLALPAAAQMGGFGGMVAWTPKPAGPTAAPACGPVIIQGPLLLAGPTLLGC